MIMKNIFKVTLLITIIFSSSSVLAQSNDKKANAIVENGYGDGWNEKL
jgi:hypothetical protein